MEKDTDKIFCSIVLDVLVSGGMENVICSPGSRNAPLLIAASSRDNLKKYVITDERSAAFFALGLAMMTKKITGLICTSGSAVLNYAPAVAEAFYSNRPLVVISADRPVRWIDQDDSQTIRQAGILDNIVKRSYDIPSCGETEDEMRWYVNRIVNDAVAESLTEPKGPVHINIHLDEPLGNTRSQHILQERVVKRIYADSIGDKEKINELARIIASKKVMLVVGFKEPDDKLQKVIGELASFPNVVVMAETLSNLHLSGKQHCVDTVLTAFNNDILDSYTPELVISLGGALLSRKLKQYLRNNRHKIEHWTLGTSSLTKDCFMSLNLRIETDPVRFLRHIVSRLKKLKIAYTSSGFKKDWDELRERALSAKNKFADNCPWSEIKAFEIILKGIPRDYNLFLSNGTPVRYAQIIDYSLPHASYCNRGVSGIDGSVSTAMGGAAGYKGKSLLVTGDLSMSYDLSAFSLSDMTDRLKIIVIDNQGGGIFRFIPSTSHLAEREKYFCAPPRLPLRHLAEGYGWKYMESDNEESLRKSLKDLFKADDKVILKVKCDGELSARLLREYMNIKII